MLPFLTNSILTRGFWGDEAWTVLISRLPWLELVKTTAADFHPPLYYTIVHFWIRFFSSGEVTIRLISLIFWVLSAVVAYFFAKALKMSAIYCLLAAAFILFNPFVFTFAFEARNYTLFVCLSLVSTWLFYEVVKNRKSSTTRVFFYVLFSVLGLYTHYYMFFVVGAQYLFIFIFRRDLSKNFILYSLFFLLLYFPWLPFFFSQTKSVAGGYWIGAVHLDTIAGAFLTLIVGEQRNILTYLLAVIFGGFFGWAAIKSRKILILESGLFLLWFLVPFILPLLLSLYRPIFFYRYLVFLAAPLMIWPIYLLATQKKTGNQWLIPVATLLLFLLVDGINFATNTDQHFKPVLAAIHRQARPGEIIYTVLPSFAEVVYYNGYDGQPMMVKVVPVGLSQASGRALLDTYVRLGYLTMENPPPAGGRYWYLEPGPKYKLVTTDSGRR